ncbi:hypothetical protein PLESTB_000362700 [Pleodorina starrii]|uniref:Ribonuclease H2 subunit B n=1 Tax=Pleodorina starrii TaxID=330485 RepID=A0A9W6BEY7_9CHLO|nr:hypothetical protein PLESTM_000032500 [Pleodorina starrii]GLC50286.1 hypothetical protein PLESTB_000362700 [Pleodorina starrii]GLC64330.1 hypothetical protein PLESTF_000149900 [Pleodorina starrii]
MTGNAAEDETWRVVMLPGLERGQASTIKSFTLPDPRTGRPQGFLLVNGSLLEVNRFKQSHSAWLMGDRLLADGGMFLATVYDPLFALLPVLDRARGKDEGCPAGMFKELEELLYDGSMPGLSELLPYARGGGCKGATCTTATTATTAATAAAATAGDTAAGGGQAAAAEAAEAACDAAPGGSERCAAETQEAALTGAGPAASAAAVEPGCGAAATLIRLDQQLACICDVRKVDDMCYYRLNEDRVLAWLCCKFRRMQAALAPQLAGMDAAHAAAYVLGFLAEYVGDPWVGRVAQRLGVKNEKELAAGGGSANANGGTLQPTDGNTLGTTRPGAPLAGPPEKKQKIDPRVASKQAALAKQAVGTKKLTSFFTKK